MTDREMQDDLRAIRGITWVLAEGMTWTKLSNRSGLCYQTLRRFFTGETKNPGFRTVWRLCRAVGVVVAVEKKRLTLRAA